MNIKNGLICVLIAAVLSLCTFNSVVAAPVSKQTTNVHSNSAVDVREDRQQTYLLSTVDPFGYGTTITMGVGQSVYLHGALTFGTPPTFPWNSIKNGIASTTVNIQSMNSDGKTWSTVATTSTWENGVSMPPGWISVKLTPMAAGVYTYRMTYDGDSQYAPAVSNVVTLTVTNVAIS